MNQLDLGMSLERSLAAPRLHHQWRPDVLVIERTMPAETVERLESFGHRVELRDAIATAQGVTAEKDGSLTAGPDPRVRAASARRADKRRTVRIAAGG